MATTEVPSKKKSSICENNMMGEETSSWIKSIKHKALMSFSDDLIYRNVKIVIYHYICASEFTGDHG